MPTLPLPHTAIPIDGGDLPVSDWTDVKNELPSVIKAPTNAPVRDALCKAFAAGHLEYTDRVDFAAAQTDALTATGKALREIALERGVIPAPDEDDESLRGRILATPQIVTPDAIESAVNAIISKYTNKSCQVYEPNLDGWFLNRGTATWHSFVGANPSYPSRYYEDFNNRPGGARLGRGKVRTFHIRIPAEVLPHVDASLGPFLTNDDDGWFIGTDNSFVFDSSRSSADILSAIVGAVNRIKGQGINFVVFADPKL